MSGLLEIQKLISKGENLLQIVQETKSNEKPIPGSMKLAKKIKSEIRFLHKIEDGTISLKPCHITSSNLTSLQYMINVINIIGPDNTTALLRSFGDDIRNDICVDIVANGGRLWVKVVARNAAALHVAWSGQGQFGERNLINTAKDYIRIARSHPVDYQTPKVVFYFTNGVPIGLSKELSDIGVLVDGKLVDCMVDDSSSEEDNDVGKLSEALVQTIKLVDFVHNMSDISQQVCASEISKVNLDISTMLTLVSNLSNGFRDYVYGIPVLDEQASQERNRKVLPKLQAYLSKKTLFACETAVNDFKKIVHLIGGPKEKERAKELLKTVTTVPDHPSERTLKLISSSKLNKRAKIIFGTGDSQGGVTVTANSGFVRAASQHGVQYSVYEHEPRALTELKEKSH